MSTTTFIPNELAVKIDAPYLEEWSWVGCGVDDTELEAIACNILSRYQSTTSLIRIDLSDNQIQYISAKATQYFPHSLQILILDGNPILCDSDRKRQLVDASAMNASTKSYSHIFGTDNNMDQHYDDDDHNDLRGTTIRDLLVTFPYLGFLGDDFESRYTKSSSCTPELARELRQMMRANRNRSRMLAFQARVVDGKHRLASGLWPQMLQQSLHAFPVSSTWEKYNHDDHRHHHHDRDRGRRKSMNTLSMFQNPQELDQRDAIYLMLRGRGALELFR
jgi:hypothetical protein